MNKVNYIPDLAQKTFSTETVEVGYQVTWHLHLVFSIDQLSPAGKDSSYWHRWKDTCSLLFMRSKDLFTAQLALKYFWQLLQKQ